MKERGARQTLSPEQARQGRIALTTPTRRAVFFGGLVVLVVLGVVAALL